MENLMNNITRDYFDILERGCVYNSVPYELVQHPTMPGVLLRKRYDFVIFKKDKILIYPKVYGSPNVMRSFASQMHYRSFKLPGHYAKLLQMPIQDDCIKEVVKADYSIDVKNVVNANTPDVELYNRPIVYTTIGGNFIIAGDYVELYTMEYSEIIYREYMDDLCGEDDDDEEYITRTADICASAIWAEYSILVNPRSAWHESMIKVIEDYVVKHDIKDSLKAISIELESGETAYTRDTITTAVEELIHEFIFDNPALADITQDRKTTMYNLLRMVAVEIPTRTVLRPTDVMAITKYILKYFDGTNILFDTSKMFGRYRPSMFVASDYTRLSEALANSSYQTIPSYMFYTEFQVIIDLIYGIMGVLDDMMDAKYDPEIYEIHRSLEFITSTFMSIIPKNTEVIGLIGPYTIDRSKKYKYISTKRPISF